MTINELLERIEHIRDEYCPATQEQQLTYFEQGHYDPCGCSICQLLGNLLVDEIIYGMAIVPGDSRVSQEQSGVSEQ